MYKSVKRVLIAIGVVVSVVVVYCGYAAVHAVNRTHDLSATVFYGVVISKTHYPPPSSCSIFSVCESERWVLHIQGANFYGDTVDQELEVLRVPYDSTHVGGPWLYITQVKNAQAVAKELGVTVTDRNFQVAFYQTSDLFASDMSPFPTDSRVNQHVIEATRRINSGTYLTEFDKAKAVQMIPTIAHYLQENI